LKTLDISTRSAASVISKHRLSKEHLLLQDDMSLKAPKLCLQGAGSDEALAHAIDTDNVATHASAVPD
jgi:hypothetical protein